MVEILVVSRFVNQIGTAAQGKGYQAGKYRLMAIILWCLGELAGLFGGLSLATPNDPASLIIIYICALAGAGAGAAAAYSIVRSLKQEFIQQA